MASPRERLIHEILMARKRVYAIGQATPLEELRLDRRAHTGEGPWLFLKREDLSPIHSYKWRGAYNRMAAMAPEERARGVVCASAGNHAQGVALAARALHTHAEIYMPRSTPRMKQDAVRLHGGDWVEVALVGDTFDVAAQAACEAAARGREYIHPYDDLLTMAGQGTLADEIVLSGKGPFDAAYIQIGGGGLAAGVACWLKEHYPDIRIIGVEGVDQASMAAAVRAGHPVRLDDLDVFCDGTAVRQAGDHTYPMCAELVDEFLTVTNAEVSAAIAALWRSGRCIAEPSGAMGLAGFLQQIDRWTSGQRVLTILCGANADFERLAWIAQHASIGDARRRFYRVTLREEPGQLANLLDVVLHDINIADMQYGKRSRDKGEPVFGFEGTPERLVELDRRLSEAGIPHRDVTLEPEVEFRMIPYEVDLLRDPVFIACDFPERPGALRDFLAGVPENANICYFNYQLTGEAIGHALIGFECADCGGRDAFRNAIDATGQPYREVAVHGLSRATESAR